MPSSLDDAPNRVLPALITPLTSDGLLDEASAVRLVDSLYDRGVGGLYITGSTGEGIYLDDAMRRRIAELAVERSRGRGTAMVHVGSPSGQRAEALARHAAEIGADAVSALPPFVGGFSWPETVRFYESLAKASPLPVVAYYIPALTKQHHSIDRLAELLQIDNVAGFKFTDCNLYLMQRLATRLRPGQLIYSGMDELLAFGLQMGSIGGIGTTYNFMPQIYLDIARLVAAGKLAEAVDVQQRGNVVIEALLRFQGVAATKQILYWQGLIDSNCCASPRLALDDAQQLTLRALLDNTFLAESFVR